MQQGLAVYPQYAAGIFYLRWETDTAGGSRPLDASYSEDSAGQGITPAGSLTVYLLHQEIP